MNKKKLFIIASVLAAIGLVVMLFMLPKPKTNNTAKHETSTETSTSNKNDKKDNKQSDKKDSKKIRRKILPLHPKHLLLLQLELRYRTIITILQ